MIKYMGGMRKLIYMSVDRTFFRGVDEGQGYKFEAEERFMSPIVHWDFGQGGVVVLELKNGEVWKRKWIKEVDFANWEMVCKSK